MPRLSLTDLVDIVLKAGTPKATKVAQVKNRDEYSPGTDFYKQFRDGIVGLHKAGGSKADISTILHGVSEKVRQANYPVVIAGYKKWWGKKNMEWFQPPSEIFSSGGIEISINPELGLIINEKRHLIKLYLKADKLNKNRADLIMGLMSEALALKSHGAVICVLDVRNSKLFCASAVSKTMMPMIEAEIAYIASIWPKI